MYIWDVISEAWHLAQNINWFYYTCVFNRHHFVFSNTYIPPNTYIPTQGISYTVWRRNVYLDKVYEQKYSEYFYNDDN